MNRKILIGCASAFGVVVVLLVTLFYFFLYRPAQAVLDDLDQIAGLAAMNQGIQGAVFSPPESGEVTEDQYLRFSRVQDSMQNGLGNDYDLLRERALTLVGMFEEGGDPEIKQVGVKEAIMSLDGLGPVLLRAKEIQINALNREGFSLAEYRWVRENWFQAMGFSRFDIYFEDVVVAFKTGDAGFDVDTEHPPQPEINRDRAALYSDSSGEWLPFLVFGL